MGTGNCLQSGRRARKNPGSGGEEGGTFKIAFFSGRAMISVTGDGAVAGSAL